MEEKIYDEIINHAKNMRKHALDMSLSAGQSAAHFGGGLSIIDILSVLYFGIMNTREVGLKDENRDRFILSKGHGVIGFYSALIEAGFIDESEKETFEKDETFLLGHPVIKRDKGIEFTNGSLGMGLSLGIGVALANKMRNRKNKVYVLLGDGECDEGSVWEAFMAAPKFKLENLVAIIDYNGYQLGGETNSIMSLENFSDKLRSFNWKVCDCNGHDVKELYKVFIENKNIDKPLAIVAHTIKGKGFSFSENDNSWHHAVVTKEKYDEALKELNMEA